MSGELDFSYLVMGVRLGLDILNYLSRDSCTKSCQGGFHFRTQRKGTMENRDVYQIFQRPCCSVPAYVSCFAFHLGIWWSSVA
jgi:hypothetical protein